MKYIIKKVNKNPQTIDERNWFYDGKEWLEFVHEVVDKNGNYIQTDLFKVPIKKLADFIRR